MKLDVAMRRPSSRANWHGRTKLGEAIIVARYRRQLRAARNIRRMIRLSTTPLGAYALAVIRWLPRRRERFHVG